VGQGRSRTGASCTPPPRCLAGLAKSKGRCEAHLYRGPGNRVEEENPRDQHPGHDAILDLPEAEQERHAEGYKVQPCERDSPGSPAACPAATGPSGTAPARQAEPGWLRGATAPARVLTLNPPERPEDPRVKHGDHSRDDDGGQRRFGDVVEERGEVRQREQDHGACRGQGAAEPPAPHAQGARGERALGACRAPHGGVGGSTCDKPSRGGADARLRIHRCAGRQSQRAVPGCHPLLPTQEPPTPPDPTGRNARKPVAPSTAEHTRAERRSPRDPRTAQQPRRAAGDRDSSSGTHRGPHNLPPQPPHHTAPASVPQAAAPLPLLLPTGQSCP